MLYYESVRDKMGKNQSDWTRLFMVPGMAHCRGGDGPNTFDLIGTLEQWREKGTAPAQMMGSVPVGSHTSDLPVRNMQVHEQRRSRRMRRTGRGGA